MGKSPFTVWAVSGCYSCIFAHLAVRRQCRVSNIVYIILYLNVSERHLTMRSAGQNIIVQTLDPTSHVGCMISIKDLQLPHVCKKLRVRARMFTKLPTSHWLPLRWVAVRQNPFHLAIRALLSKFVFAEYECLQVFPDSMISSFSSLSTPDFFVWLIWVD